MRAFVQAGKPIRQERRKNMTGTADKTTVDLPMIDTVFTEVPDPRHPFGLRGVGESPIVPPPAALANAVHAATGVRLTRLPMSPGAILDALNNRE
ncbi:MAG: hypothetical protein IIC85_11910 [Chloroflexi bacterium]|nr:hypothetical protein [Chloroflexota bacterium]